MEVSMPIAVPPKAKWTRFVHRNHPKILSLMVVETMGMGAVVAAVALHQS